MNLKQICWGWVIALFSATVLHADPLSDSQARTAPKPKLRNPAETSVYSDGSGHFLVYHGNPIGGAWENRDHDLQDQYFYSTSDSTGGSTLHELHTGGGNIGPKTSTYGLDDARVRGGASIELQSDGKGQTVTIHCGGNLVVTFKRVLGEERKAFDQMVFKTDALPEDSRVPYALLKDKKADAYVLIDEPRYPRVNSTDYEIHYGHPGSMRGASAYWTVDSNLPNGRWEGPVWYAAKNYIFYSPENGNQKARGVLNVLEQESPSTKTAKFKDPKWVTEDGKTFDLEQVDLNKFDLKTLGLGPTLEPPKRVGPCDPYFTAIGPEGAGTSSVPAGK